MYVEIWEIMTRDSFPPTPSSTLTAKKKKSKDSWKSESQLFYTNRPLLGEISFQLEAMSKLQGSGRKLDVAKQSNPKEKKKKP